MMHAAHSVISISDLRGKTFREFDHHREGLRSQARVVIPFGTEYRFNFRFSDGRRRRIEVSIDGANVARDLIVTSGCSLERFMDSDKRFMIAPVNAPGVADPGSSDNGRVEITLWAEKIKPRDPWAAILRSAGGGNYGIAKGSAADLGSGYVGAPAYQGPGDVQFSAMSMSVGAGPADQPAATVEGSISSQQFDSTTWAGSEGGPEVFIFHLRGRAAETSPLYCGSCGARFPDEGAKFCSACGAKRS